MIEISVLSSIPAAPEAYYNELRTTLRGSMTPWSIKLQNYEDLLSKPKRGSSDNWICSKAHNALAVLPVAFDIIRLAGCWHAFRTSSKPVLSMTLDEVGLRSLQA